MIDTEIRKKISNHPTITNLEREVVVYRVADNMDVQQINISARIEHFEISKDGTRTLLPEFSREIKDWIISNDYEVKKRDKKNNPILDDNGAEVKIPAYDLYHDMVLKVLTPILEIGIINDDEEIKRFNK